MPGNTFRCTFRGIFHLFSEARPINVLSPMLFVLYFFDYLGEIHKQGHIQTVDRKYFVFVIIFLVVFCVTVNMIWILSVHLQNSYYIMITCVTHCSVSLLSSLLYWIIKFQIRLIQLSLFSASLCFFLFGSVALPNSTICKISKIIFYSTIHTNRLNFCANFSHLKI